MNLSFRTAVLVLAGFLTSTTGMAGPQSEKPEKRPLIHTLPVSLLNLIDEANLILRGTVQEREQKSVTFTDRGKRFTMNVVDITFTDVMVYKQGGAPRVPRPVQKRDGSGFELVVRQPAELASNIKIGGEVLWFLPQPSRLGLALPIGVDSGSFVILRDKKDPSALRAINGKANESLWAKGVPFLTAWPAASRESFESALVDLKLMPERHRTVLATARKRFSGGDLPLELLLAAIKSRLADTPTIEFIVDFDDTVKKADVQYPETLCVLGIRKSSPEANHYVVSVQTHLPDKKVLEIMRKVTGVHAAGQKEPK